MPLVFVHGVNVRASPDFHKNVEIRDSFFARFALDAVAPDARKATILNPYWGDLGAKFAWNHAALPPGDFESFGSEEELLALLLRHSLGDQAPDRDTVLLDVARHSLADAIDLLWAVSAEQVGDNKERASTLADLAVRAMNYAHHHPNPSWLASVTDNRQFLRELGDVLEEWQPQSDVPSEDATPEFETFGFSEAWNRIREAASRVQSAAGRMTSRLFLSAVRPSGHRHTARFLGDAFTYLNRRGSVDNPGPIVCLIMNQLKQARQQVHFGDPKLIVVGHSMGGNILYDILSHFLPQVEPDFHVDAFVTVGSQVALFEELKLFAASDGSVPADPQKDRVTKPTTVGHWLNIFDHNDVFSFATEGVFEGTRDFSYSTGKGMLMAHGAYFTLPSFHQRLAARLRSVLL